MVAIDIVGDVHGQWGPLRQLLMGLGYGDDGVHPDGRTLVFLGDLVDRGPDSLKVAQLVRRLCAAQLATCLLGNHEFNLVEWRYGRSKPKSSNAPTIEAVQADPPAWAPILDFFETLPVALELADLRVIHAVWHRASFRQVYDALRTPPPGAAVGPLTPIVALHSPYAQGELRSGVPTEDLPGQSDSPLEILIKGHESVAQAPFRDNDGALRHNVRTEWWRPGHDEVATDKRVVFGHYWNVPPVPGLHASFVPPFPSGHPDLRRWFESVHASVPAEGRTPVPGDVRAVCIDYNGVTRAGARASVGAYRYPEAEVVWAAAA